MALADQTANTGGAFLQSGPAIGIVRSQGQPFQQKRHVAIRNRKGRRIDRSGERPVSEPLPKPIPHRNPVEPQRRTDERLEKLVALRRVEPRPALHRGRDQIDAPHSRCPLKSGSDKRNAKNEKRKYAEVVRSRGLREGAYPPKDPRNQWAVVGPSLPALRRGISLSRPDRQPDLSYRSRTPRQGCNCMFFLTSFCWE